MLTRCGSPSAVTCTGAKDVTFKSPAGYSVFAATWRTENPAILDIELRGAGAPTAAAGLDIQYTGWRAPQHVFFESCKTKLDAVYSLPGPLWATERAGKTTLYQADKVLAVVSGTHAAVAP